MEYIPEENVPLLHINGALLNDVKLWLWTVYNFMSNVNRL